MHVEIDMGTTSADRPALLDLEELLATRLLVQGNSGSGKSHLLRRLLEQSAPWVQQCVIDPEGDFVTLSNRFGHVVVDADRSETELAHIAARIRQHRVSCVVNLEGLEADQQLKSAAVFLNGLFEAERDHWYPALVVVDEAQLFAPSAGGEVTEDARRSSLGAMTNLMCRGRKRGLAGVIATQRLAKLAKNVAAEASNFLMGRTFLDIDMARAADLLGMERRQAESFRDLQRGKFMALGPAISRRPMTIAIGPVETQARSTSPRLTPLPETPAPDEAQDLIFAELPQDRPAFLRRSAPKPRPTDDILSELAASTPDEPLREAPEDDAEPAERAAQIHGLMRAVVAESSDPFRSDAEHFQDFQVRCRIEKLPECALSMAQFRRLFALARAGVEAKAIDSEEWTVLKNLAGGLPDDLHAVFYALGRAALEGAPCPSDAVLARIYRTHSPRRARRLIEFFEQSGLIVMTGDASRRIAVFPDIDRQTAPGDADAPDRENDRSAA